MNTWLDDEHPTHAGDRPVPGTSTEGDGSS